MTRREFLILLDERASAAGVGVSPELGDQLGVYFDLLALWNQKINLTGFSLESPTGAAIDRLLVEPLVAAKAVRSPVTAMLDIGSGGGSPAIPMALTLLPNQVTLVEARARKAVFLREAGRAVDPSGRFEVLNARFEDLAGSEPLLGTFDLVTVRAVRVGVEQLSIISSFLKAGGQLVLFTTEDQSSVPQGPEFTLTQFISLRTSRQSSLAVMERV